MAMTLEQARDWLRENPPQYESSDSGVMDVIAAIDAHLSQPAQAVDVGALQSRLAAADALLRDCDDFMENLSIDMRKFGELLSLREKVQAHLQGAGDE